MLRFFGGLRASFNCTNDISIYIMNYSFSNNLKQLEKEFLDVGFNVELLKVFMKRRFLLHHVKELLKLEYNSSGSFALQRFVDEISQFDFFVSLIIYVTLCIMSCC